MESCLDTGHLVAGKFVLEDDGMMHDYDDRFGRLPPIEFTKESVNQGQVNDEILALHLLGTYKERLFDNGIVTDQEAKIIYNTICTWKRKAISLDANRL